MAVSVDPPPRTSRRTAAKKRAPSPGPSGRRGRRPAKAPVPFARTKCGGCIALCCRYFAIEVDAPTEPKDFDDLKWYLLHDKVQLFTEGRSWYVQVFNRCTNLGPDQQCLDYENRPAICREYENDFCDRDEVEGREEPDKDLTFRTVPELEEYKTAWVRRWEARRRRARREAARKAAATRRRNARRKAARGARRAAR